MKIAWKKKPLTEASASPLIPEPPKMAKRRAPKTPANPSRDGFFRWTVELQVHELVVSDGFDMDDARAKSMLDHHLPHAHGSTLKAKVVGRPPRAAIRKAQGGR